jgi:NitT/TauT family transport system substrate-binding protein
MLIIQTRRRFLTTLSVAGGAVLLGARPAPAAEGALETTTVRLARNPGICIAPQYVAEELLRAEGFTDIRYVEGPLARQTRSRTARSISILIMRRTSSEASMPASRSRSWPG